MYSITAIARIQGKNTPGSHCLESRLNDAMVRKRDFALADGLLTAHNDGVECVSATHPLVL
jgi:hypothetical protein